jgi:hypothetical protein
VEAIVLPCWPKRVDRICNALTIDPRADTRRGGSERVLGFFNTYRGGKRVTRRVLTEIADQFQNWLKNRSEKCGAPVLDAPEDERRDDFVLPYRQLPSL